MASRGNKPLKKKEGITTPTTLHCLCCNGEYSSNDFYDSDSEFHASIGKIPYCKKCLDKFYQYFLNNYETLEYPNPERKTIERICMVLDIYYSDKIFNSAVKESENKTGATLFALYLKHAKLYQHRNKNYDTTIHDKFKEMKNGESAMSVYTKEDYKQSDEIKNAIKLFGSGFSNDDYIFLYDQYADWTTRHECETKSQEEIFKRICFKQLEIFKATKRGDDTKDLDASLLKMLEAAKLQPKQNRAETVSDTQTFGTLIDKWENTRPIPECDPELKDVDRIGKYIDIFFKGHLSKMMGIKNVFCKAYDDFMKKYSVQKPEYESEDSNSEALFDVIFGGDLDDC